MYVLYFVVTFSDLLFNLSTVIEISSSFLSCHPYLQHDLCVVLFRRSNRIQIRNVPPHSTKEDIEHLVASFGTVQRCELGRTR